MTRQPTPAGRQGLPRGSRLLRTSAFQEAYEQRRSCHGRLLVLWVRGSPEAAGRLGVVAGKRVSLRAVDRNRAKRLMREAFRLHRAAFPAAYDYVLVARRAMLGARRQEVEQDLLRTVRRAGPLAAQPTGEPST